MATPVKSFSQAGLERMCRFWQRKLRLADWRVTIRYASGEEFGDDSQGRNYWNDHSRTAEIWVLSPDDYNAGNYPNNAAQDIEDTVVHELIHLHLVAWNTDRKPAEERCQEQAIEAITGALVALKRRMK